MAALLIVLLLLFLIFGGVGFAVHTLWIVAIIALVFMGILYLVDR